MPSAPNNHRHGAGVVIGGKFYVAAGGFQPFASFDVYDPGTNSWKTLGALPFSREFAVGAPLQGKVYVLGISGSDTDRASDRRNYVYDPVSRTWTTNDTTYPGPVGEDGQFLATVCRSVSMRLAILLRKARSRCVTLQQAPVGGSSTDAALVPCFQIAEIPVAERGAVA